MLISYKVDFRFQMFDFRLQKEKLKINGIFWRWVYDREYGIAAVNK